MKKNLLLIAALTTFGIQCMETESLETEPKYGSAEAAEAPAPTKIFKWKEPHPTS